MWCGVCDEWVWGVCVMNKCVVRVWCVCGVCVVCRWCVCGVCYECVCGVCYECVCMSNVSLIYLLWSTEISESMQESNQSVGPD